jgi:hypothetical protein
MTNNKNKNKKKFNAKRCKDSLRKSFPLINVIITTLFLGWALLSFAVTIATWSGDDTYNFWTLGQPDGRVSGNTIILIIWSCILVVSNIIAIFLHFTNKGGVIVNASAPESLYRNKHVAKSSSAKKITTKK